ncbi:MAG: 4-(cytidine 5'-diphospho)-2-C-methyl-D-erythritol kinase [Clostridiales bacterium]|nr:4-(cytidine 5'-diphospho)-2-C-methyl-D-erythritol kinase [Clostridiales bacterium]
MDSYEITANAKINLFLRVCGILPNGYHSLYSVMQEIDLSDSLTVNIYPEREEGFEIKCIGRDDIDPEKNLCRKARDRFFSSLRKKASADPSVSNASVLKNGTFPYIEMVLTKRIPSESGMGGGSSDAAAVLMVLQEHFGDPFTESELNQLAVNVGADVPFFLYGGTCLCERVGEDIKVLDSLAGIPLLIVKPSVGVSTPECFRAIDSRPLPPFDHGRYSEYINSLNSEGGDPLARFLKGADLLTNDLEAPSFEKLPEISDIREALLGTGAVYSRMTGSGSAVFAMYEDGNARDRAYEQIRNDERFSDCDVFSSDTI